MHRERTFLIRGAIFVAALLIAGCTTSELVDVWSDPSFQPPALTSMLVISVSQNSVQRRLWEDAFSAELAKHHVAATPSYRQFPDAVPDTDQVILAVRTAAYDGVLITRRLPTETTTQAQEGYVTTESRMRYDPRRERFYTYYRDVQHAATVDSQKVRIRAIDVWSAKGDGHMIWSATSRTPEPSSVEAVRPNIVGLVLSELKSQGIIAP